MAGRDALCLPFPLSAKSLDRDFPDVDVDRVEVEIDLSGFAEAVDSIKVALEVLGVLDVFLSASLDRPATIFGFGFMPAFFGTSGSGKGMASFGWVEDVFLLALLCDPSDALSFAAAVDGAGNCSTDLSTMGSFSPRIDFLAFCLFVVTGFSGTLEGPEAVLFLLKRHQGGYDEKENGEP